MAPRAFLTLALLPATLALANAEARLAPIFQSGMVLQRGNATRMFGSASPNERVTIRVGTATAKGRAGQDGRFDLKMRMPAAGGPYMVEVKGESGAPQRLDDVLVGEVWFCSGQSNMEWEANWFSGRRFEVGESDLPGVRLFKHAHRVATKPLGDALGTWEKANPTNARAFSLVGFLFGRQLHKALGVPVGLVESAWGGTPAESWIDLASLQARPELQPLARKFASSNAVNSEDARREYANKVAEWSRQVFDLGVGVRGIFTSGARKVQVPGDFESQGLTMDGVTWLSRTVNIPESLAGKDLTLELGPIDDFDVTYFNGAQIGRTGPETPNAYSALRKYTAPGLRVNAGDNTIQIRVIDTGGEGGPRGAAGQVRIGDGTTWIPLSGTWDLAVESDFAADAAAKARFTPPTPPVGLDDPWLPTGLYSGMVTSVAPYSVRGAIWYQGESNVGRDREYRVLFPAMIESWRRTWANPDMAFHFVQLASFGPEGDSTTESGWALLREAQAEALKLRNVGMAVAIDAGEANDIHPIRKDLVADRLARAALAITYRQRVPYEGPKPVAARTVGDTLRIRMANGRGMKTLDGAPIRGLAVAGADSKFHVAQATIEGQDLVLRSPSVSRPTLARYAWADFVAANLANEHGLPAAPFRISAR